MNNIDDTYYYLGMIYLNENRLKEAIYYFTYLIDNFPQSGQLSNATFLAQKCAKMLVEQKEIQKKRGLDVSISSPSPRPPKPFMERATSN